MIKKETLPSRQLVSMNVRAQLKFYLTTVQIVTYVKQMDSVLLSVVKMDMATLCNLWLITGRISTYVTII